MARFTAAKTGVGSSSWIDFTLAGPNDRAAGLAFCVKTSGTVTYDVEHTFDVIDASEVAFKHSTVVGKTANADGNYQFLPMAVRVTVTAGSGTATLVVVK